jgi:hypothetical protein
MEPDKLQKHIISTYFWLRLGLGSLALIFPVLLVIFGLREGIKIPGELSAYYWALAETSDPRPFPMRGLFVGMLWAIGCFLILYRGFSKVENLLLIVVGVCALVVAIAPMAMPPQCTVKTICMADAWSNWHKWAAIALFISIGVVVWWCSGDTLEELKRKYETSPNGLPSFQKDYVLFRTAYYIIAVFMIAVPLVAGYINYYLVEYSWFIIFVEWWGITFFGIYWLLKTWEIQRSGADIKAIQGRMEMPDKAPPRKELEEVIQYVKSIPERVRK